MCQERHVSCCHGLTFILHLSRHRWHLLSRLSALVRVQLDQVVQMGLYVAAAVVCFEILVLFVTGALGALSRLSPLVFLFFLDAGSLETFEKGFLAGDCCAIFASMRGSRVHVVGVGVRCCASTGFS